MTGNAKRIIDEIYQECVQLQKLETDFIEKNLFSQRVSVAIGSIRNTCCRLRTRGVLQAFVATKGRGSAWKFMLEEKIFNQITAKNLKNSDTISDTSITSSSSYINNKTTTDLPDEWANIKTSHLQSALNNMKKAAGQIFNLSQIKAIYATKKLTASEVQKSIDHFAYGIENHPDKAPYDQMKKPAGFLVDTLKNGSVWEDKRYFSPEERLIKKVYQNLVKELEANKKNIFQQWVGEDTEQKREKFREKLPSNYYFGEREFKDMAWKEFNQNIWAEYVKAEAVKIIGEENTDLIIKINSLLSHS